MDQEREIGQAESDRIHIVSLQVTALQEVFKVSYNQSQYIALYDQKQIKAETWLV